MNTNFENKLTYKQISFRYAKGKSLVEGNETHPYHEILYYIKGNATFLSERFEEKLSDGTLLIIPKETYHKFYIGDQDNYTRLVLNFPDVTDMNELISSTITDIMIVKNINSDIMNVINRMCRILSAEMASPSAEYLLYGAFYMLMAEINTASLETISPKLREDDHLVMKCIQYIDRNFTRNISVDMIAKEMNVSVSTLFHCFKKHLGISLYRYITEKRLMYAYKLLGENKNPTKIYFECGYNDYATFYKAYLKMFGHSPSADA